MNQREMLAAWLTVQQRSMFWHWLNTLQMKLGIALTDTCQTPRFSTLLILYKFPFICNVSTSYGYILWHTWQSGCKGFPSQIWQRVLFQILTWYVVEASECVNLYWQYIFTCLCFQMGYLRKESDGSLLYTVVNQLDPDAEGLPIIALPFVLSKSAVY